MRGVGGVDTKCSSWDVIKGRLDVVRCMHGVAGFLGHLTREQSLRQHGIYVDTGAG
jgi:hypothetical protein